MRKLTITLEVKTRDLTEEQVQALYAQVGYPAIITESILVQTTSTDPKTALQTLIAAQKAWIAECGGDLAGYIKTYGSVKNAEYSGSGGEAIYAADMAELERLERRAAK